MRSASSSPLSYFSSNSTINLSILLALAIIPMTGCGSGGSSGGGGQKFGGNASVTVVLTSTADDQLSQLDLEFETLSLTSQSGKIVNLLSAQQPSELIHLNGGIEPLTTVSVPQDIYTAATATIGGADFTCVTVSPSGSDTPGWLDVSTFDYGYTPDSNVTVNLPSPITIASDSMAVVLNLLVSQSASYPGTCYTVGNEPFSITPTFNLTPLTVSSQPTSSANGKVTEVEGEIASINAANGSFALAVTEGPGGTSDTSTVSVASDTATLFQGISAFAGLQVGTFVDMDGAIQPDGSLLATRIAVEDPSAVNVMSGPLLGLISLSGQPLLSSFGRLQQGPLLGSEGLGYGGYFSFGGALFQTSGQLTNLQNLPFVATFNSSNLVAGQNIYMSFTTLPDCCGNPAGTAQTVTLIPQTINGTVFGSAVIGEFTDYTVSLASYDLFPALTALQNPWQGTPLTNPNIVEVYVDNNTQLLNTQPLAAGSTLRFYGLVFNDNGTLRMDCAQVNDGVTASSQSSARRHLEVGESRIVRSQTPGRLLQTTTVVANPR
jgi:hypothetical protein